MIGLRNIKHFEYYVWHYTLDIEKKPQRTISDNKAPVFLMGFQTWY
ncbi:hypothetical protein VIBNISFn118_1160001 [Vibrio nigripulchritudo SFn118]|nr:hypothetical protein VIBNISFn118_1160001 [Vibrio nigripulchritudo SFn118]